MPNIGKHLAQLTKSEGHYKVREQFAESLRTGRVTPEMVSVREMAEAYMGPNWRPKLAAFNANRGQTSLLMAVKESGENEAVDASQFADITGQLLINEIKKGYEQVDDGVDTLVHTSPIVNGNLSTQRTPWLSSLINDAQTIQPGMPYPKNNFGEQFIDEIGPEKFGSALLITMEAIYSDLTNQMMDASRKLGERIKLNKSERILRVMLGLVRNHKWNGTNYVTYGLSTDSLPWINAVSGLQIRNWEHINTLDQLFWNMTDPVSGKPINIRPEFLLVMPPVYRTHERIRTATDVRSGLLDGTGTNNVNTQTYAPSPIKASDYSLHKSQLAYNILQTSTANGGAGLTAANAQEVALYGKREAVAWRQAEAFTTVQAPAGNWLEFNQDIALAVKGREWGAASVCDPRYIVLSYNAGTASGWYN
jgi:hypothetical protein